MRKKEWRTNIVNSLVINNIINIILVINNIDNSFIVAMDGWFRKLFVRKEKRILFSDALNYLRKFGLRFTIYETFKTFSNDRIAINFFLSFFDNFRRYLWKYISICLWVCICICKDAILISNLSINLSTISLFESLHCATRRRSAQCK